MRSRITALVAVGGTVVALAAKAATSTVPTIFVIGDDPVKAGLVGSLNRPGGNITGVTLISAELSAKRIELLRDLKPEASTLGMLINPANPERCIRHDNKRRPQSMPLASKLWSCMRPANRPLTSPSTVLSKRASER